MVKHFCQKNHSLRFFIFKTDKNDLFDRMNLENQFIHLCLKFD